MSFQLFVEMRDKAYEYIKSLVPTWPDYVVQDFLYKGLKNRLNEAPKFISNFVKFNGFQSPNQMIWTLQKVPITMEVFDPMTREMLQQRMQEVPEPPKPQEPEYYQNKQAMWQDRMKNLQGGLTTANLQKQPAQQSTGGIGGGAAKDAARHATQATLTANAPSSEPVIIIHTPDGYRLEEGWHRTIQSLKKWPQGYQQMAWILRANRSYDWNNDKWQ